MWKNRNVTPGPLPDHGVRSAIVGVFINSTLTHMVVWVREEFLFGQPWCFCCIQQEAPWSRSTSSPFSWLLSAGWFHRNSTWLPVWQIHPSQETTQNPRNMGSFTHRSLSPKQRCSVSFFFKLVSTFWVSSSFRSRPNQTRSSQSRYRDTVYQRVPTT